MEYEDNTETKVPLSRMSESFVFRVRHGYHCQSGIVLSSTMEFLYLLVRK
jgi:hypothetical protein